MGLEVLDGLLTYASQKKKWRNFRLLHGGLRHFVEVFERSLSKKLVFQALGDGVNVGSVRSLDLGLFGRGVLT
jgi:hypothetical protein